MHSSPAVSVGMFYSRREELANALTHGVGLLACLIGVPILIASYLARGDLLLVLGVSVFAASLLAVYTTSTLYHAVPHPRAKHVLRLADHVAIYRFWSSIATTVEAEG